MNRAKTIAGWIATGLVLTVVGAFWAWPRTHYPSEVRNGECLMWQAEDWFGGMVTQIKDGPVVVPMEYCP